MLKERVKPVVLGLVLAFIAGSYFRSDVFKRGEMASFSVQLHEHFVCQRRVPDRREECRASLAKALIPTKLSCLPSFRDMFVCQNPSDSSSSTNKKNAQPLCPKELQLAAECLEKHLAPYGFGSDDVLGLVFGKQQLPPKEQPSLEVTDEGGVEDGGGKAEKLADGDEVADKKNDAAGSKTDRGDGAPEETGGPKVEVEQESGQGGDKAR